VSLPNGSDPIDRLRATDPVHADDVPDASLARVTARVQEHIMSDKQFDPTIKQPRGPLAWVGGLALAGAFALAIAFGSGAIGGPASAPPVAVNPTPTEAPVDSGNPAAGGGVASCLVYDPANVPTFDIAFDGTVTGIDGDQVTFTVNTAWKGVDGTVTLTAPEENVALTGPLPDFQVGGRYLVTASGTTINACGYTLDYDEQTATDWAAAFAAS
jgi:hypothetical protein